MMDELSKKGLQHQHMLDASLIVVHGHFFIVIFMYPAIKLCVSSIVPCIFPKVVYLSVQVHQGAMNFLR